MGVLGADEGGLQGVLVDAFERVSVMGTTIT